MIVLSCSSSRSERLTEQSITIHEEALDIGLKASDKITQLEYQTEGLDEPMRLAILDSVEVLKAEWKAWESAIVEIPGHKHAHHDHDHHEHNHSASPDLTPEMMMDIQKDLKNRIVALNIRTQKLLDSVNKKGQK